MEGRKQGGRERGRRSRIVAERRQKRTRRRIAMARWRKDDEDDDEKLVQAKNRSPLGRPTPRWCAPVSLHAQIEFSRTMQHSYAPWVLLLILLPSASSFSSALQLRNKRFLIEFEFWGHLLASSCSRAPVSVCHGCCRPRIDVVVARFEVKRCCSRCSHRPVAHLQLGPRRPSFLDAAALLCSACLWLSALTLAESTSVNSTRKYLRKVEMIKKCYR